MTCTLERQQNLHRHKSYPGHSPNVDPWYVQFTEANRCRGRTDWSWLSKTWLDRFFIVLHKCWLNPKWLKFLVICWLKYVKILALHRHQCFFSAKGPPDTEMQCDAAPEDWEMRRSARTWGRSTLVDDKRWLSSSIRLVTSLCVPLGKCIHHIMIYYDILCPMNSWLILHPSHFVEAGQIMSDSYAPHLHPFTSNKTGSATKTLQHPVDPEMPNKQSIDFPL